MLGFVILISSMLGQPNHLYEGSREVQLADRSAKQIDAIYLLPNQSWPKNTGDSLTLMQCDRVAVLWEENLDFLVGEHINWNEKDLLICIDNDMEPKEELLQEVLQRLQIVGATVEELNGNTFSQKYLITQ